MERDRESYSYQKQYVSIRYNYMLQYAPELLGEKAQIPELTDESEEGIRAYLQDLENREKALRKFWKIYRDVYRYYGVTQKDIETKSERYEDLVRTLTK